MTSGSKLKHLLVSSVFLVACLAMAGTWSTPWVYPALLSCLGLMLILGRDLRDLAFFGLGIILGGSIDLVQTGSGVTVYAVHGPLILLPPFVLLYWGLVGVSLRHLYRLLPGATFHPLDAWLFAGAIGLSALANLSPLGVAAIMAVALLGHAWRVRRPADALAALALALMGPLTESVLIHQGLYHFPSAGGALVPGWLFPLYACMGAASRGIFPGLENLLGRMEAGSRRPTPEDS